MKKKIVCLMALSSISVVAAAFAFAKTPETREIRAEKTPLKIELNSSSIKNVIDEGGTYTFDLEGKTELDSFDFASGDGECWFYATNVTYQQDGHMFTLNDAWWASFGLGFNIYSPAGEPTVKVEGTYGSVSKIYEYYYDSVEGDVYHVYVQECDELSYVVDSITIEYYCA